MPARLTREQRLMAQQECMRKKERTNEAVATTRKGRRVNMYQIYSLVGLMVMTWGLAIWASFSETQDDVQR